MSGPIRRGSLSLGLAAGWYVAVLAILAGANAAWPSKDFSWLARVLLFPLGLLSGIAERLLIWSDSRSTPGHPWHIPLSVSVAVVVAHVLIVWSAFYALVAWRERRLARRRRAGA